MRPQSHRYQHAEKTAVKTHPAFPDGKDFQRIGQVVARFVEQHLPQPAANDHAKHAVEQQVVELLDCHQPGAGANAVAAEQNKLNESDQIHQTVPAHRERADREGDRVELGVEKHCRVRVG